MAPTVCFADVELMRGVRQPLLEVLLRLPDKSAFSGVI
jgi:hypothetical protein